MRKFKTMNRFLILLCVTIAIALLAIGPVWAEEQEPYQSAIITARTEVWRSINSGISGSATVAIMDQGQLVYAEGFGMANRAKSIRSMPRPSSILGRSASCSATAVCSGR